VVDQPLVAVWVGGPDAFIGGGESKSLVGSAL